MKTQKIIYWSTTGLIALFEGVMPALTSQTKLAKEGIKHLGYPEYFGDALVIFKVLGVLILIAPNLIKNLLNLVKKSILIFKDLKLMSLLISFLFPKISINLKEWAYAGFAFNFIFAAISHGAVDGINFQTFFPFIVLAILMLSYVSYHKLKEAK